MPQLGESGAEYAIDAGGGADIINVPVEITAEGDDPARWGDGSDVTRFDATGAHVYTRAQVLKWWIRNSRTGSGGPGKLHIGEWTDGRFGEAGAFDAPIDVQVMNFGYEWERDDPSAVTGSVTVRRIDSFPEFASDGIDTIGDVLDDLTG